MKTLLVLLVLAGIGYYFYQQGSLPGVSLTAPPPTVEKVASAKEHDFNAVSAMLHDDMSNIPASLTGDGPRPVHAYDVKRRVRPHLNLHVEYQTLTRVCDLIIQADTQRSALQQSTRAEQSRTTFHSVLDAPDKKRPAATPGNDQAAIRQRVETTWVDYRTKTTEEVDRLLGTLKGKRL